MKKLIAGLALFFFALAANALQPYTTGGKVAAGDLKVAVTAVEQKLGAAGSLYSASISQRDCQRMLLSW